MTNTRNLLWLGALLAIPASAQEVEHYLLDTIDVTTDVPEALAWDETQITEGEFETQFQGSNLQTILRSTPGVTVLGGAAGGAETAVNIRGLQDYGRVAVTADGMRQNFARSGHDAIAAQINEAVALTLAATSAEVAANTSPDGTYVYAWQKTQSVLATLGFIDENGGRLTFSASRLEMDYYAGRTSGLPRDNDLCTDSYSLGYQADDVFGGWAINGKLYGITTQVSQRLLTEQLEPTEVD